MPKTVGIWKEDLVAKNRKRLADAIADPSTNPELFEESWEEALAREAKLVTPKVDEAPETSLPTPVVNGNGTSSPVEA